MSNKSQQTIQVSKNDLPIYCPPKTENFWAMHPRVYIDHHNKKEVSCPYCGTLYRIK